MGRFQCVLYAFQYVDLDGDSFFFSTNCRRPGSEFRHRDMGGHHIFKGPYPVKENCGGDGSDITGCCRKVIY